MFVLMMYKWLNWTKVVTKPRPDKPTLFWLWPGFSFSLGSTSSLRPASCGNPGKVNNSVRTVEGNHLDCQLHLNVTQDLEYQVPASENVYKWEDGAIVYHSVFVSNCWNTFDYANTDILYSYSCLCVWMYYLCALWCESQSHDRTEIYPQSLQ